MRHLHRFDDTGEARMEQRGHLQVKVPVRRCACGEER